MPLQKIRDFDPDYRQHFNDHDVLKFDVYSGSEKVGSVDDLLVDEGGQFRYLVINTGVWIVGKKVLVPISRARINDGDHRVYVDGLTRDQVKNLPEYKGDPVDYDYEERVRGVYRPMVATRGTTPGAATYDRTNYRYDLDPGLYNLNDREHESWRHSEARMMSGKAIAGPHRRAVGAFPNRSAAEHAMHELRDSGFPMGRVSIITRDADKHDDDIAGAEVRDRVGNKADEGATIGAVSGGVLGGLTGLLVGLGTLAIPGVGPVMLAGATATALATTLAGGAIGAVSGGLLGALIGLGIPEERARVYENHIARGGYLVIVDGTDEDIARAEAILHRQGIEDYGVYDAPTATAATPVSTLPATRTTPIGKRSAVGFFPNVADAEYAVTDPRSIGFPLNQISLVAHDFRRRDQFTDIDLRDRFEAARLGIPAEVARLYNDRLGGGEHMVIVHGTEDELNRAAPILNRRGIQAWRTYDPTVVDHELPVEAPRRDYQTLSRTSVPTPTTPVTPSGKTSVAPTTTTPVTTPVTPSNGTNRVGMQRKRAIGIFSHRHEAEAALTELRSAGFPMDQVSLIAKHGDNDRVAGVEMQSRTGNKADEGAKAGAATGGALGGLGGLLVGLGTLAIPGFGPVMLGGAAATALATTLAGGAIGAAAGGLTGALVGLGIPEDRAKVYNDRVAKGDYLVMIDGTEAETRQAEATLRRHNIHEWSLFDATDVDATRHSQGSVDHLTPDVDSTRRDRDLRVEHPQPNVTIIDRRDETRH